MMRVAIFAVVALISTAAGASDLSGPVRVIDGDTLAIAGVRVRIWGIDAPESRQTCGGRGGTYECGRDATAVMRDLVRDGAVDCAPLNRDLYGRIVAICRTSAGDLGDAMVRRGWAVDYTRYSHGRYRASEDAARRDGLGIWASRFEFPWRWRRKHRR